MSSGGTRTPSGLPVRSTQTSCRRFAAPLRCASTPAADTAKAPRKAGRIDADRLRDRQRVAADDAARRIEAAGDQHALRHQQQIAGRRVRRGRLGRQHARRLAAVERAHVHALRVRGPLDEEQEPPPVGQELRPPVSWSGRGRAASAPSRSRPRPRPASGLSPVGANTMTPSRFHVPPRAAGASASTCGAPPVRSIRFSLPSAKSRSRGRRAPRTARWRPRSPRAAARPSDPAAAATASTRPRRPRRTRSAGRRARAQTRTGRPSAA